MSLFDELKRRNVIRVGAAYLALGWIVIQVTDTLAPAFNLPAATLPLVTWIGVAGFPFVLLFAWIYELTPEGLKRESEVDRSASITSETAQRLDRIVIALLVAAIGLFAFHEFRPPAGPPVAAEARAGVAPIATTGMDAGRAPPPAAALPQAGPDPHSIAVLPFVDMSAAKDQDYMSDGIAEELLNLLAKIPELRVTSRSSAFVFKGEKIDIAQVAAKLNVAHVLEGSVRTSGNRVRITAQLIDARSDQHLWSESYDRTLDDIFAVQDEIAAAVVTQLEIKLLGKAPKSRVTDPELYSKFLRARELGRVFTTEAFEQSNALLKEVLAMDPQYAEAWERLGTNYINMTGLQLLDDRQSGEMARDAYQRALAIDPALPSALDGIAWIEMFNDGDLAAAARDYARVLELAPGNVDIIANAGRLLGCLGRNEQALEVQRYSALVDPSNPLSYENLAGVSLAAGRYEDAIANLRTVIGISGGQRLGTHYSLGRALLLNGEREAALAEVDQESVPLLRQLGRAIVLHSLGRNAEANAEAQKILAGSTQGNEFEIAALHAWRGENDQAFAWLDKAVLGPRYGLCGMHQNPMLASLHTDARWQPLLERLGRSPEQLDKIAFEIRVPN